MSSMWPFFGCLAVGWTLSSVTTWPLWLGAAAITGTLASAGLVYWKQLRVKEGSGPLHTSVSAARDDRLSLAAVGAPIFFSLLVVLAVRERLQRKTPRSVA